MHWRTWLGNHRRVVLGVTAGLVLVALIVLITRTGGGSKDRVTATGATASSSSQALVSTSTSTTVTVPDLSTTTALSTDTVPGSTPRTPTTHGVATTLPATTVPPVTDPPGVPAGYARIEIVNSLGRTVVVHLDSVGAIDATLGANASRGATDMAATDDHADGGNVKPPGESCGAGSPGDYFSPGHRYRVTVTTWDGNAEGGPCAAEPTPMLRITDLDTGVSVTTR